MHERQRNRQRIARSRTRLRPDARLYPYQNRRGRRQRRQSLPRGHQCFPSPKTQVLPQSAQVDREPSKPTLADPTAYAQRWQNLSKFPRRTNRIDAPRCRRKPATGIRRVASLAKNGCPPRCDYPNQLAHRRSYPRTSPQRRRLGHSSRRRHFS